MTRFQKFLVISTLALFAGCTKKTPDSPELGQQKLIESPAHGTSPTLGVNPPLAGDSSASLIDTIKNDTTSIPTTALPEPRKKSVSKKAKRRKGKGVSRKGKRKKGKRYGKRRSRRTRRVG